MKLIIAQGNPGAQYHDTRHNVGFRMLDTYAVQHDATWSEKPKFHSYMAEFSADNEKILLAKPTTYYNDTGRAARTIADFYKISSLEVLALHDDIALPLGTVRARLQGSDAGNNGIKSLNAHLGQQYARLRIGIWSERANLMDATAFVLGKFTPDETRHLARIQTSVHEVITTFIHGTFEATSYKTPVDEPTAE